MYLPRLLVAMLLLAVCQQADADNYIRYKGRIYVKHTVTTVEKKRAPDRYESMRYQYVQKRYGPSPYRVERRVKTRTLYIPIEKTRSPYYWRNK